MESRDAEVPVTAPTPDGPLRVLHCEDMPSDGELVERMLRRWHPATHYLRVAGESAFRDALRDNPLTSYSATTPSPDSVGRRR